MKAAIAPTAASESPKRAAQSSFALASSSSIANGARHKRLAGESVSELPLMPKKKSSKKTDAAKKSSGKQGVALPKVSSITYSHSPQPLDSGEELEILKCILVREGYLQRLAQASTSGRVSGSHLGDTVDLLDLLRIATLEAVETIAAWRKKKRTQDPYRWNNLNYLLKMPSDLDFLQKHTGLVQWLGFTLERNPFILPLNLDCQARVAPSSSSGGGRSPEKNGGAATASNGHESGRFVEVGGKRRLDYSSDFVCDRPVSPSKAAAHAAALAERKRAKNPYETRVLNDEELLPLNAKSGWANGDRGSALSLLDKARPRSRAANTALVIPSQIGELDMSRIRDAELLILQEEARLGRFTRDTQGHIVPEEEAQRRLNMVEMSGGAYTSLASDARSGVGSRLEERQEDSPSASAMDDDPNHAQLSSHPPLLAGKLHAKKKGGMLGPISKPTRKPILQGPRRRSRGAQFEEALEGEKQANMKFGVLIDALREEIERKEMDVAYFESIAGVQFYGEELREFSTKARREIALLRRELAEKEYIFAHKMVNIHKKEEIIHVFKETQKSATEAARATEIQKKKSSADDSAIAAEAQTAVDAMGNIPEHQQDPFFSNLSNQEQANRARALVAPVVQHMCATLIQKIARGMVTRAAFESLKIEYYVSSKYIQAAVRGFLVRRRVAKLYWENAASLIIQRLARGMLARRLVRVRQYNLLVLESTIAMQKVVRGHFGRIRMHKVRHLFSARADIVAASDNLEISEFKELGDACFKMVLIPRASDSSGSEVATEKPLTPLVLGLVRMLMLFTCDSDSEVDVSSVRWKEAGNFLRCTVRLVRRMKKIAVAAERRYLRESSLGNALLDAYLADQEFHEDTFKRLASGWKGATTIFKWITSFSVITRLQSVLPAYNLGYDGPFLIANALDKREVALDQIEASENAVREEDVESRFVPAHLVQVAGFPHHRPRPVVLVFAHDVPLRSKAAVMDKLLSALPGLFIVMNRCSSREEPRRPQETHRGASLKQSTSSSFQSLHDTPWNISKAQKKKTKTAVDWEGFDIAEIRHAVSIGYNVILESDIGLSDPPQRQFLGAFSALKAAIQPAPLCILVKGSLKNRAGGNESVSGEPEQGAESGSLEKDTQRMADGEIKHAFELAAEHLFELSQPQIVLQMTQISAIEKPAIQFIVVMEAVIILLTPTKRYDGPKASTSYMSWKLGRRLLGKPSFFHSKLQEVNQQSIARENLLALDRYLQHADWPTRTRAHSLGSHGDLLFALSCWVEAIVSCAHLVMDRQGLAPEISRTTPVRGLFGSVVTLLNTNESRGGDSALMTSQDSGETACVLNLMDAVLSDVQVYRKCHELDGKRCVVNVYHDCLRIFFSAYDPTSSWRWQTVIVESDVDNLLAPNSIERGNVKVPPQTRAEMYDRLVQLCLLQARQKGKTLGAEPPPSSSAAAVCDLVVRPRAIRLYRRVIHLSGYLTTVTISELSRGRVQVDVFVHNSSNGKDMRSVFSLESILKRMSARQAKACFVEPSEIPKLVLDRLHLFRTTQSTISREESVTGRRKYCASSTVELAAKEHREQHCQESLIEENTAMKLGIRSRETSPGRILMRKAVRSPWLNAVWLCSVFENHATDDFRVEFYQPQSSDKLSVRISQRDCEDFVLRSKFSSKPALQLMVKHFRFQRDAESSPDGEDDDGDDRSVVGCQTRRILARFPFAIPSKKNPHHLVTKREVVRVYIQVERQEFDPPMTASPDSPSLSQQRVGQLKYRICLPDTCEEQSLVLADSEIESYFASTVSWLNASSISDRKRMSRELVACFVWESAARGDSSNTTRSSVDLLLNGRVVAQLPFGAVEASTSTRVTGKKKKQAPPRPPSRVKRSPFSARGSLSDAPVLSSCVQLLDPTFRDGASSGKKTQEQSVEQPALIKRCYTYNSEEMIHKGSYRANGVLVIVQVFMKAVIVDTLVSQIPVDRTKQEDSFVMTFNFYHPHSSSGATALVEGRNDLREVVGPDKAHLIRAAAVHELMQHIVERRTDVALKPTAKVVHSNSFRGQQTPVVADTLGDAKDGSDPPLRLEISFQRDRLYAKQKVTPINQSFVQDHAANATKLIDKAPERGLKVLTRTRAISGFGRVILTVFDVGFTRQRERKRKGEGGAEAEDDRFDLGAKVLRVDAYIHDTSSRLSFVVEGADILHVIGDDLELLLGNMAETYNMIEQTKIDESEKRIKQLAQLIIDHVGIESRHDGATSDRLFITNYFTPEHKDEERQSKGATDTREKKKKLLFKTTRALGHDQILVSVYLLDDCGIAIRCYEPRSSQAHDLAVHRETLSLVLGLADEELGASVFESPQIPLIALMTHICSFVRIEKTVVLPTEDAIEASRPSESKLAASLIFDDRKARQCRSSAVAHGGNGSEHASVREGYSVISSWSGMVIGRERPSYFVLRIAVLASGGSIALADCEVVCSAFSPSALLVTTARFTSLELRQLCEEPAAISSTEDLVQRVRERLQVELQEEDSHADNELGAKLSITLSG